VTQAAISGVQIPCDLRESITHTIETGTRTLQEGNAMAARSATYPPGRWRNTSRR
jgi:hypothetical protein